MEDDAKHLLLLPLPPNCRDYDITTTPGDLLLWSSKMNSLGTELRPLYEILFPNHSSLLLFKWFLRIFHILLGLVYSDGLMYSEDTHILRKVQGKNAGLGLLQVWLSDRFQGGIIVASLGRP